MPDQLPLNGVPRGVLGMPFVLEQPNLGKADENHLYFDPGDDRLLTVFTNESRDDVRSQGDEGGTRLLQVRNPRRVPRR